MARSGGMLGAIALLSILLLPIGATGAGPLAIVVLVVGISSGVGSLAGPAWQAYNFTLRGAHSAAFAQADDAWHSDPDRIPREVVESGHFTLNRGDASSRSIANARGTSGSEMFVIAESNWNSWYYEADVKIIDSIKNDGYVWGKGIATSTFQGDVVKEQNPESSSTATDDRESSLVQIPVRCIIPEASIISDALTKSSLDIHVQAWIKDTPTTEPEESSWQQNVCETSLSRGNDS